MPRYQFTAPEEEVIESLQRRVDEVARRYDLVCEVGWIYGVGLTVSCTPRSSSALESPERLLNFVRDIEKLEDVQEVAIRGVVRTEKTAELALEWRRRRSPQLEASVRLSSRTLLGEDYRSLEEEYETEMHLTEAGEDVRRVLKLVKRVVGGGV